MKWQHGETWYRVEGDLTNGQTPLVLLHGGPGVALNYLIPIAELVKPTGLQALVVADSPEYVAAMDAACRGARTLCAGSKYIPRSEGKLTLL